MKSFYAILVATAFVAISAAALAQQSPPNPQPILLAAAAQAMTDGEIRKVDLDTKKITIKHGELKNLEMPAMTMVFQVNDPAMLTKVKVGDQVKFRADKVKCAFTVMEIEVVK